MEPPRSNKYAFSGGRAATEKPHGLGGDFDVDVAYQYLSFSTDDDSELSAIREH